MTDREPFSFGHLTPVQFEELCYDLLRSLGYTNLSWRKGTTRPSTSPDQGRDLEATLRLPLPDADAVDQKWFVQCKHHEQAVPASELDGILSAALRERPDCVLIITSRFLSNPAKEHLSTFERTNKPPFHLRVWERPKLIELLETRSRLRAKYNLAPPLLPTDRVHPAHVAFMLEPPLNSLDYLFDLLDKLEPDKRREMLGWIQHAVIAPRYRRPKHPHETLGELLVDRVDYPAFKKRCYELAADEVFVTHAVVSFVLGHLFHFADPSNLDEVIETHRNVIEYAKRKLRDGLSDEDIAEGLDLLLVERMIATSEEMIATAPARKEEAQRLYEQFCEQVVLPLFQEDMPMPRSTNDLPFVD